MLLDVRADPQPPAPRARPRNPGQQPRQPPKPPRRADAGPVASGTVTGQVEEVERDAVGRRQHGHAVAACGLAVVAIVALLLFGGAHRGTGLLLLLPTLIAVAALAAAPYLVPRDHARTTVTRFRLTAVSGEVRTCELLGIPTGTPPRAGDGLDVFGRRGPVVRVDEIVRGEERLRGRAPFGFLVARHSATAALALSAVCTLVTAALVVTA